MRLVIARERARYPEDGIFLETVESLIVTRPFTIQLARRTIAGMTFTSLTIEAGAVYEPEAIEFALSRVRTQ